MFYVPMIDNFNNNYHLTFLKLFFLLIILIVILVHHLAIHSKYYELIEPPFKDLHHDQQQQ